jgi:flagellar biosynthesis protein FlhF
LTLKRKLSHISEIRRLLQEKKEAAHALAQFLIAKGISSALTEEIIMDLAQDGKEWGNINDVLAAQIRITGDFTFQRPHHVALVGPTGVGKTTTLLKLAQFYKFNNKKVAIGSLDSEKKETLAKWAQKEQFLYVDPPFQTGADILLLDTEGCNFYQPSRIETLGEKIAECSETIEVVLTLSAAAKEVDLYGAVHQFSVLSPACLAFTKLDETLASGVLINVCARCEIPIRYVAFGFPLPGEVQVADAKKITHKILTDFNQEEFHFLRQLSLTD